MGITAKDVNELRQLTGAGLMDCKKALTESNGDIQAAVDYLRKKGQKVSELRAGRDANEGVVIAKTTDDGSRGVAIRLSCETDFVARNEDFIGFADEIASLALAEDSKSLDDLLNLQFNGANVKEKVAEKVGAIGENISISAYERLEGVRVIPYIHAGYKIGVLVSLNQNDSEQIDEVGKDLAMQVAAMNPAAVDKSDVAEEVVERELKIGKEQALAEGKPENMVDKIAEGKLQKFFKENTLLNQQFVKDGSKSVSQILKEVDKELNVKAFKRLALGSK